MIYNLHLQFHTFSQSNFYQIFANFSSTHLIYDIFSSNIFHFYVLYFLKALDVYGKLPLHYVADRAEPNLEAILCLLKAYPQGYF